MPYVIGVSSGIFAAATEEERIAGVSVGLYRKAQYCITKGVEFVQLDLESVSEFREPDLKINMEKIKRLGITFGIHSETRAFGVEVAELDAAIETDYKFGHERLREILEKSGEIGSKYVLIHSSESEPFLFLERHLQPTALVDFFGNPFRKFLEKDENKWLIDWMFTPPKNFIWVEIIGMTFEERLRREVESEIERFKYDYYITHGKEPSPEEVEARRPIIEKRAREWLEKTLRESFLNFIESRALHYGPERFAYWLTAKWMEKNKDPLWINIVNSTIDFFAKRDKKTREEWLKAQGIKELSIDDENFRKINYLWVPAISAKYIWGHLNQDKNPEKRYPDLKPIIKKYNMPLVLETPMAHRGVEEWLRLPNPIQFYYLVKEVGEEYLTIALDFEHLLSIKLEPELVIEALPEDAGKFIRVIHAGWPAPLAPAHIPIPLGSEQQVYLYKMLFKLRQKGFGKDKEKEYFIVFERGGGVDPIRQSIIALRKIVEFLEKEVPPEKLPLEFYGLATGEWASPERQLVIIKEHRFEPLKGLIVSPEEEYTFLGRAAIEKVPPEKWKREELR